VATFGRSIWTIFLTKPSRFASRIVRSGARLLRLTKKESGFGHGLFVLEEGAAYQHRSPPIVLNSKLVMYRCTTINFPAAILVALCEFQIFGIGRRALNLQRQIIAHLRFVSD